MDEDEILAQIEVFQRTGESCLEWVEQNNLNQSEEFSQCLLKLLLKTEGILDTQKLLIICFMKECHILFNNFDDINSILHFLGSDRLNYMTAQLIVNHFNEFSDFFEFLRTISDQNPSYFLILLKTYIERKEIDESSIDCMEEVVSTLKAYLQNPKIPFSLQLESVKCLKSLSKTINHEETVIFINNELFLIFQQFSIDEENIPIFFEILQLRYYIESIDQPNFYSKILELSEFCVERGPQKGLIDISFNYYISELLFHLIENSEDICPYDPKHLITSLLLFTAYHDDDIEQWRFDVEEFYSCNSKYLNAHKIEGEDDENTLFKEASDLHQFIYGEIVRLGQLEVDETTDLLSLAIDTCMSIFGAKIPNYSASSIGLSVILFFMNLDEKVEFDSSAFIESGDEILDGFLTLYWSKKQIEYEDVSEKIECFLGQDSEMFKLLTAAILINYNTEAINPSLYCDCFVQCAETISSFNSEKVAEIMAMLQSLSDFENKPLIVPDFEDNMHTIMQHLINGLVLLKDAYRSTESMCDLIAHFINYIDFQSKLLPFFFSFISRLCSSVSHVHLGIRLENSILNCKSSSSTFSPEQVKEFDQVFASHLEFLDFQYLIENPSIIPTILSILNFFAKNSMVDVADEWIHSFFSIENVPLHFFDGLSKIAVSLLKSENSEHRFDIFKMMVHKSDLFVADESDGCIENPLLYQTICLLAYLSISDKEQFVEMMLDFKLNLTDTLTAINSRFKANLDVLDDRLILVMLLTFGDEQVYVDDQESTENLMFLNQFNTVRFFEKVVDLIQNNKVSEFRKSAFFDLDDDIFDEKLMACSLSDLLNALIPDTDEYEVKQSKKIFLEILEENGL